MPFDLLPCRTLHAAITCAYDLNLDQEVQGDLMVGASCGARVGELIYYHEPHKFWLIAGSPQLTIDFILKFHLYLTRDRGFL